MPYISVYVTMTEADFYILFDSDNKKSVLPLRRSQV